MAVAAGMLGYSMDDEQTGLGRVRHNLVSGEIRSGQGLDSERRVHGSDSTEAAPPGLRFYQPSRNRNSLLCVRSISGSPCAFWRSASLRANLSISAAGTAGLRKKPWY
jgi:hypothetical protein